MRRGTNPRNKWYETRNVRSMQMVPVSSCYQYSVWSVAVQRPEQWPSQVSHRERDSAQEQALAFGNSAPKAPSSQKLAKACWSIFSRVAHQKKKPIQKVGKEGDIPQMVTLEDLGCSMWCIRVAALNVSSWLRWTAKHWWETVEGVSSRMFLRTSRDQTQATRFWSSCHVYRSLMWNFHAFPLLSSSTIGRKFQTGLMSRKNLGKPMGRAQRSQRLQANPPGGCWDSNVQAAPRKNIQI